jgi:predicted enzyme related to lactoylglutathione lyase
MRLILSTIVITALTLNAMGQNKHPMNIAMVSVLVEDPVKAFKYYTEVLGFEEVMYMPENMLAIVKSPLDKGGTSILLEPISPGGTELQEAAKAYKNKIYSLGAPVITFGTSDIMATADELKAKGVVFKQDPVKTEWGYIAVFDDDNGNYIQLFQAL